jgi:hypothetical protein
MYEGIPVSRVDKRNVIWISVGWIGRTECGYATLNRAETQLLLLVSGNYNCVAGL